MSDHTGDNGLQQQEPLETEATRSLLDQLLEESRLYKSSKDYKELLGFVVRLRNFAPFNAMLLQMQKPGLRYAASAEDWEQRFGRRPKEAARPLLILWPFGPVALVYDRADTEGKALPEDGEMFVARGAIGEDDLRSFELLLKRKSIDCLIVDEGDRRAGLIRVVRRAANEKETTQYRIHINGNHNAAVKFATLAHELGHLTLGHLGYDKKLSIPQRPALSDAQQELEAESVAYIVCARNRVQSKSQTYLANFVTENTTIKDLDVYQVMRAAGQVEALLGLTERLRAGSARVGFMEAFAKFGAKPVNPMWAVSAIADDGALVISCWSHLCKSGGKGVLVYTDCLSRWSGNKLGCNLLRTHLAQAVAGNLPVRMVVATTAETEAVDQGHDASKVIKTFHVREDVVGRVASFDGDKYTLEFRRAA